MTFYELVPAYGRDFKNAKEAKEAYRNGADFFIPSISRYASIRDFENMDKHSVNIIIRYGNLRKVTQV
jgi:hypothetical protein